MRKLGNLAEVAGAPRSLRPASEFDDRRRHLGYAQVRTPPSSPQQVHLFVMAEGECVFPPPKPNALVFPTLWEG